MKKHSFSATFTATSLTVMVGLGTVACSENEPFVPPAKKLDLSDYNVGTGTSATTEGDAGGATRTSPPKPAGGPTSNNPDLACGKAPTTSDACYTCCEGLHAAGAKVWRDASTAYGKCLCQTPGTCATACRTTYCNGQDPAGGDACSKCMQSEGQCDGQFRAATGQNADYAQFDNCIAVARCDDIH